MWTLRGVIILSVLWASFSLTGCLEELANGSESGTKMVSAPGTGELDPSRNVCDPFKTNSSQARDRGLVGNLVYLTNDQPRYDNVQDYIDHAVIAPVTLYLDRLYTPPRPFDLGFSTQSGELVTSINGDTVYQYFGIQLKSQLQLGEMEEPGYYQLALLADVGGKLKLTDANGVEQEIVNAEGTHSTKFACASQPVYLDHNSKIPMTVEYYQGDSRHISLMAMWRPWPDGVKNKNPVKDVFCERNVHSLYEFSDTAPALPKASFYEMLARGWKVIENENYSFPEQENNPCVPSEPPLAITNFRLGAVARDRVTLEWTTNIPATGQGTAKNVNTQAVITSPVDSTLVVTHSLTITGLSPNTLYSFQALSGTPSGQSAISDERAVRTPR